MKNALQKDSEEYYLFPYIATYDSLDEIKSPDESNRFVFNHDQMSVAEPKSLNKIGHAFVISEPGYGKSRLLNKLSGDLPSSKSLFIDLKQSLDRQDILHEKLNNDITNIYLDGLDEVSALQFSEALDQITSLIEHFPALHVFVSCRTHYLKRWQYKIAAFSDFKFIVIQQFSEVHIRRYLEHFITDEQIVESILHKSSGSSRDSVLRTPRYLESLVKSIIAGQWTAAELTTLTRVQIFEKVIYYQLLTETKKKQTAIESELKNEAIRSSVGMVTILEYIQKQGISSSGNNELLITQRVLEKLALIMEIYQKNRITKDELISFLDETHSNISQAFLQNFSVDVFIERTLKNVDFDYLEFENTEFQEYLAAKELIRMSNSDQVLYDLIIEKNLNIIVTNWFDVIQYAIELNPQKVAGSLANHLAVRSKRQVEERLIDLMLGPGMEKAEAAVKKDVFKAVFTYFQYNGGYIYHKDHLLAQLYHPEHEALLALNPPQNNTPAETMRFVNSLLVTGQVSVRGMLPENLRIMWVNYLISLITKPLKNVKYEEIFCGLEAFGAHAELIALYPQIKKRSDKVVEWYLDSLGRIVPDQSVDIFIDILQKKPGVKSKERFFDDLTTFQAINRVLDVLLKKKKLIETLFNNRWSFTGFYTLFDQIKGFNNISLNHKIERFFFAIAGKEEYQYLSGTKKAFMERAVRYLILHQEDFFARLLKAQNHGNMLRELAETIAGTISAGQFAAMENAARNSSLRYYDLYAIVGHLERDANFSRKPVISEIKHRFKFLFKNQNKEKANLKLKEKERINNLYIKFKKLLKPGKDQFNGDVFKFYLQHYSDLQPFIKSSELKKIKNIIRNIIENVEPENFHISVKNERDRVNYELNNSWWFNFGFFVRMALFLDEKAILQTHRDKIIKYLPLLRDYNGENIEVNTPVMDFLGPLTSQDIQLLLTYCSDRSDDYLFSATSSFIDLIKDYKLIGLQPFLQQIIASSVSTDYEKIKALQCYRAISDSSTSDRYYLGQLFSEFDPDVELKKQLGDLANEILISTFSDKVAITWRFSELKRRQILTDDDPARENGLRPYPEWEAELDKPKFGRCLYDLHDNTTLSGILDLLKHALTIRKIDRHKRYSEYLMIIVYEYFQNNNNLKNINKINSILANQEFSGTAIGFKPHLVKLENELSTTLTNYTSISDPVRIYNNIQATRYLPVYNQKALADIISVAVMDMENFVVNKGYSHTALQLSGAVKAKGTQLFNEDVLQKTLSLSIENSLLRQGIREADIIREAQLSDDQRLDLLVKYGFIGPVMIELKLLHNPEIQNRNKRSAYLKKLIKYKRGIGAEHAVYLIFKVRNNALAEIVALHELYEEYQSIDGLEIKFIDCTKGFASE